MEKNPAALLANVPRGAYECRTCDPFLFPQPCASSCRTRSARAASSSGAWVESPQSSSSQQSSPWQSWGGSTLRRGAGADGGQAQPQGGFRASRDAELALLVSFTLAMGVRVRCPAARPPTASKRRAASCSTSPFLLYRRTIERRSAASKTKIGLPLRRLSSHSETSRGGPVLVFNDAAPLLKQSRALNTHRHPTVQNLQRSRSTFRLVAKRLDGSLMQREPSLLPADQFDRRR